MKKGFRKRTKFDTKCILNFRLSQSIIAFQSWNLYWWENHILISSSVVKRLTLFSAKDEYIRPLIEPGCRCKQIIKKHRCFRKMTKFVTKWNIKLWIKVRFIVSNLEVRNYIDEKLILSRGSTVKNKLFEKMRKFKVEFKE